MITNPERNLFYFQLKDKTYHIIEFRNTHSFFGGLVEDGEKNIDAIKRELSEELEESAAKLISNKIKFILKHRTILKYSHYKGKLEEFSLFESILSTKDLIKISNLPIKEGERGLLIKRKEINKIKFNGVEEIIDKYLKLNDN